MYNATFSTPCTKNTEKYESENNERMYYTLENLRAFSNKNFMPQELYFFLQITNKQVLHNK